MTNKRKEVNGYVNGEKVAKNIVALGPGAPGRNAGNGVGDSQINQVQTSG